MFRNKKLSFLGESLFKYIGFWLLIYFGISLTTLCHPSKKKEDKFCECRKYGSYFCEFSDTATLCQELARRPLAVMVRGKKK